jgi:hypothetical protein
MWHSSRGRLRRVRPGRWLAVALTVGTIGFAGCGDESGGEGETTAAPTVEGSATDLGASGDAILIRTQVNLPTGVVLSGSSIGDSPFCPGGTFRDQPGDDSPGSMDRTFRCPEGTLRIGFTTGTGRDRKQTGSWKIISGTGAFAGLRGSGQMEIEVQRDSNTKGHETFTGTLAQ